MFQVCKLVESRCRFLLSRSPATPRPAEETASKKLWSRLGKMAKAGGSDGSLSSSSSSKSMSKFTSLVDGATSAVAMKQMLNYKRLMVTKQKTKGGDGPMEMVRVRVHVP